MGFDICESRHVALCFITIHLLRHFQIQKENQRISVVFAICVSLLHVGPSFGTNQVAYC